MSLSAVRRLFRSIGKPLISILPANHNGRYARRHGPKIAAIGGGTGLSTLLRGIKEYTENLTAIVTVADDGGSSGRLRKEMGILPPGDIRNCLVALADAEPLMQRLFQYRFGENDPPELAGHSFGNLFIAAMCSITGDFEVAVKESSRVLAVRGRVLPSTLDDVVLCAELDDGSVVRGESFIPRCGRAIRRVFLEPADAKALSEAVEAIEDADMIILGPGSLFTSVIPNLLVRGITEAIRESPATKAYVCNVMTQPGETDGYTASDHVRAILEHVGDGVIDYVIVNQGEVPRSLQERYRMEGSFPVVPDVERLSSLGIEFIGGDFVSENNLARHDPAKLARSVMELSRKRPGTRGRAPKQIQDARRGRMQQVR